MHNYIYTPVMVFKNLSAEVIEWSLLTNFNVYQDF